MIISYKNPVPLFVLVLSFFFSCKEKNVSNKTTTKFSKDSTLQIKLQPIPRSEQTRQYLYAISNEINIEQEVNDEKMVTENNIDVSMLYNISRDSSGNYSFKIIFKEFKVKVKAGEIEKELQATTAAGSVDAQERIFAAFDNAIIKVKVASDGKIATVDGLDLIQNKMYELARDNAEAKSMIQTSLQQWLAVENFKKNFEQTFKIFPEERIKVGYQWNASTTAVSDMNINVPLVYTFKDIEDGYGVIGVDGKIDFENQQIRVQQNLVNFSLRGEQKGEVRVDLSTGMVSNAISEFKTKGKMFILDNEIPVKMETKSVTKGERIK